MKSAEDILMTLRLFVAEQAKDEALWSTRPGIEESYLQQELRRLHRVIETGEYDSAAADFLNRVMEALGTQHPELEVQYAIPEEAIPGLIEFSREEAEKVKARNEESEIICPFCRDDDFDLYGLMP